MRLGEAPRVGQATEGLETGFLGPAGKPQSNPRSLGGAPSWAVCPADSSSKQLPSQLLGKIRVYSVEGVGSHPSGLLGSPFLRTRQGSDVQLRVLTWGLCPGSECAWPFLGSPEGGQARGAVGTVREELT